MTQTVPVPDAVLWEPDNPFLYVLETSTGGDACSTRFGMREFHFDPATRQADAQRQGVLPARREPDAAPVLRRPEVRRAAVGRSLGAEVPRRDPPANALERLPHLHRPAAPAVARHRRRGRPAAAIRVSRSGAIASRSRHKLWKEDEIERQLREFMRDNWNHPSVVIWDASNETHWDFLRKKLVPAVRGLDLSNRPWENGYEQPDAPGDPYEDHPYRFSYLPLRQAALLPDEPTWRSPHLRNSKAGRPGTRPSSTSMTGSGCTATARPPN